MYEDTIKEDEEQYLGSDDPYLDDKPEPYGTEPSRQAERSISEETFVMEGGGGGGLSTLELQFAPMQNWNILLSQ